MPVALQYFLWPRIFMAGQVSWATSSATSKPTFALSLLFSWSAKLFWGSQVWVKIFTTFWVVCRNHSICSSLGFWFHNFSLDRQVQLVFEFFLTILSLCFLGYIFVKLFCTFYGDKIEKYYFPIASLLLTLSRTYFSAVNNLLFFNSLSDS